MIRLLELLLIFYIGAIVGSFLNVLIYRVPRKKSIIKPRSYCPNCKHPIRFYDNLPIFSYLLLHGRCRHCRYHIPMRYPMVEILSGLIWLFLIGFNNVQITTFSSIILLEGLLVLAWIDGHYGFIPDKIIITLAFIGAFYYVLFDAEMFLSGVIGALISGSLMFLWAYFGEKVFKKPAIGGGDIKLVAVTGLFLGAKLTLLGLFLGFAVGGIFGLIKICQKKLQLKTAVAFAPFLLVGVCLALLVGESFFRWYFTMLRGN
jgi:leader peptidase (prepilin peptidase)/N-methyltransferase